MRRLGEEIVSADRRHPETVKKAAEVPDERRSATLNLVYLPLYAAGIVGPATGALATSVAGLAGPFMLAALVVGASAVVILSARHR